MAVALAMLTLVLMCWCCAFVLRTQTCCLCWLFQGERSVSIVEEGRGEFSRSLWFGYAETGFGMMTVNLGGQVIFGDCEA